MTVYVDRASRPLGRMVMCHMVADTLAELHTEAAALGCRKEWFQDGRHPHYDLPQFRRRHAVQRGAVQVTSEALVQICRLRRADWATERVALCGTSTT